MKIIIKSEKKENKNYHLTFIDRKMIQKMIKEWSFKL